MTIFTVDRFVSPVVHGCSPPVRLDNTAVIVLNVIWLARVAGLLNILGMVRRAPGLLRELLLRRDCLRLGGG